MNFNAVDQANGKNIKIWATLFVWEGISFTTNQAKYLSCKLRDDDGVEHKCRIYEGKGSLPGSEHLEERMEFSIGSYQGTYQGSQYTGYSGFWSHGATTSAPQDSPSTPQNAPQSTNAPQTGNNIEIRKSVVCAYIAAGAAGAQMLVEEIEYWMEYIKTGVDKSLPENRPIEGQSED